MIRYLATDINFSLAYAAHQGTSFVPDERARGVIKEYLAEMQATVEEFERYATDDNRALIAAALEDYRKGYIRHLNAVLSAQSRCMSTMITGASKFPVRRNQKRMDTADKRVKEWLEWMEKTKERLRKTYDPRRLANAPISSDDPDAVERLQAKIERAERLQAIMVAANKIVRKKLSDEDKVAELVKLDGLSEQAAQELLKGDYMGRAGFPDYELSNNSANIRRMKERIEALQKAAQRQEADDIKLELSFGKVVISENKAENRLQLIFDGKPPVEMRNQLKANGFRWAPSQGAWQRQLTENARWAVKHIFGLN